MTTPAAVTVETVPVEVIQTATRKKFALSSSSSISLSTESTSAPSTSTPDPISTAADECIAGKEGVGYRLINLRSLDEGLNELGVCKYCHSPQVRGDLCSQEGVCVQHKDCMLLRVHVRGRYTSPILTKKRIVLSTMHPSLACAWLGKGGVR